MSNVAWTRPKVPFLVMSDIVILEIQTFSGLYCKYIENTFFMKHVIVKKRHVYVYSEKGLFR